MMIYRRQYHETTLTKYGRECEDLRNYQLSW